LVGFFGATDCAQRGVATQQFALHHLDGSIQEHLILKKRAEAYSSSALSYSRLEHGYAEAPAARSASFVSTRCRMMRRLRSANASLSARQVSRSTPTA
jgi:hypothetical protein